MSSIHRIINTDNLIDLYRYSISKYDSLKAFQILGDNISYSAFNKDVEKMANYFENMKRSAIQIAIENSYYFAVAYFAVIISNNIAVLSNNNLEKYSENLQATMLQNDFITFEMFKQCYYLFELYALAGIKGSNFFEFISLLNEAYVKTEQINEIIDLTNMKTRLSSYIESYKKENSKKKIK